MGLPLSKKVKGILLIIGAAALWSTGGVLIKSVSLDAFQTSMWRALFATMTIAAFVRPKKIATDHISIIASLAYAATLILFVLGTKLTTAANAILLQYTAPIYLLVLAHFLLNERITRVQIFTVGLCVIGMTIFFFDKISPEGYLGNIFAILSGASFALMTAFLRKQKAGEPIDSIFLGGLWIMVICASITAYNSLGNISREYLGFAISMNDLIKVAALGIFQIGIPYIMFAEGIKYLRALDATMLGMLEPVLNPIWVFLIIHEVPSVWAMAGGAVIISAVIIQNIFAEKHDQKELIAVD